MAQSSANEFSTTLNGLFKEKYADKLQDLIPEGLKLYKMVQFLPKEKSLGNLYHQAVILGQEHGVTFASASDDAFNLNAPISGQIKDAQVQGNPMVLRSVLGYVAASRAATGGAAFMDATKYLVANMLRSICKKIEICMFYGQSGLGTVASVAGNVITITSGEFASGIWAGAENMPIELRNAAGTTSRGVANIASVDLSARTVTVDLMPAGVSANDVIWFKGAYGNEMIGLHKIATTSTGNLFNISTSQYSLWTGNTYSAGSAALSLSKIESAIALAVAKGLDDEVTVFVNPKSWANLVTEQAAMRKYDQSYSSTELRNGSQAIKFFGQNGIVNIEPSIYVKEAYSYIVCLKDLVKVGSSDVTFQRPGMEGRFFRELENSAGVELRCMSDLSLFCSAPGKTVVISGIVNS